MWVGHVGLIHLQEIKNANKILVTKQRVRNQVRGIKVDGRRVLRSAGVLEKQG
jgi:hypothetical protein